jgi:hypothetical protein
MISDAKTYVSQLAEWLKLQNAGTANSGRPLLAEMEHSFEVLGATVNVKSAEDDGYDNGPGYLTTLTTKGSVPIIVDQFDSAEAVAGFDQPEYNPGWLTNDLHLLMVQAFDQAREAGEDSENKKFRQAFSLFRELLVS